MSAALSDLARDYDQKYRAGEYFRYRRWLFRPFVKALTTRAKLRSGSSVLDAGCGQGFFSGLFAELGMRPVGVDISGEAVQTARKNYAAGGATFEVGDVSSLRYENEFDCVFVRGCSLYNSEGFVANQHVTESFLRYAKKGGVLIFDYYTNFCPRKVSKSWLYHSLNDTRRHFSRYAGAEIYFSLRLDTLFAGRFGFSKVMTRLGEIISRTAGLGGELVVLVPKI